MASGKQAEIRKKALYLNPARNIIAALVFFIFISAPIMMFYLFLGEVFWKVFLLIVCCLIVGPFLGVYGMGRAAAPVSPNQFLFMLLELRTKEEAQKRKTKSIEKIRIVDVIKGILFSFLLIFLFQFLTWLYGSFFFLGYFIDLVGPVVKLIMKST